MNKKISLGLIASSVLFAGNLSADTLSEAFENGKVSGEIKSQYFQKRVIILKQQVFGQMVETYLIRQVHFMV